VVARTAPPEDLEEAQAETVRRFVALASVAHFCFPIPERGLHKRLHRITSDTLVLWGAQDGLVPPVYASEFSTRIGNASAQVLEGAAHFPHIEQCDASAAAVTSFLA
jgi:pimeloyl-ACP methyl ester carboxylesterase